MTDPTICESIKQNLLAVRKAIEERKYTAVEALLAEQRKLFQQLDLHDESAREILNQAQDLTHWAILMTQMHHAHTEQALASVLKLKQLDAGYMPSPVCSAEFINLRG